MVYCLNVMLVQPPRPGDSLGSGLANTHSKPFGPLLKIRPVRGVFVIVAGQRPKLSARDRARCGAQSLLRLVVKLGQCDVAD